MSSYQTEIKFKKKSRRLTLRVSSASLVSVTAPAGYPIDLIQKFLLSKKSWIDNKLKIYESAIQFDFSNDGRIPYLGTVLTIKTEQGITRTVREGHELKIYSGVENPTSEHIRKAILKWYHEEAYRLCSAYSNHYAGRLKTAYKEVKIRNYKARWGACTSKKELIFNWQILTLEPEVFKYIVAHEVCHLLEMNHGPNFYNLVDRLGFDKNKIHKKLRVGARIIF